MKRKTLIIEEYDTDRQSRVQALISQYVKDGDVNLFLCLQYYRVPLRGKMLDSIADTLKAVGKTREFTVDVALRTDQWKAVKRLRKRLNRYAISVELKATPRLRIRELQRYKQKMILERLIVESGDCASFRQAYDQWKALGLPIRLEGCELTQPEYFAFFDAWIHDPKAAWFEPFEDIISGLLTGVPAGSCQHSSCMGKYLYLDEAENVYFCGQKKEAARMYSLRQGLPEPLYQECYGAALRTAIERRTECMDSCQLFGLCKGGCPLAAKTTEACAEYEQKISKIGAFLQEGMADAFTGIENPCVRQMYLSLIAYGFGAND